MTQNIEERTLAATATMEGAAKAVDEIANTDKDVSTPVGSRKSFPKISREWDEKATELKTIWENDSATLRQDWQNERNELSTKALGVKPWESGVSENNINQQRRWDDGHTYLPKTVPAAMDAGGPNDDWTPFTADKSDTLSDVFGRKPVDLVVGVVLIPDARSKYPKINAIGKMWELDDNDQQLTVKSFTQTSDEYLVITLDDDSQMIAHKVEGASEKWVHGRVKESTESQFAIKILEVSLGDINTGTVLITDQNAIKIKETNKTYIIQGGTHPGLIDSVDLSGVYQISISGTVYLLADYAFWTRNLIQGRACGAKGVGIETEHIQAVLDFGVKNVDIEISYEIHHSQLNIPEGINVKGGGSLKCLDTPLEINGERDPYFLNVNKNTRVKNLDFFGKNNRLWAVAGVSGDSGRSENIRVKNIDAYECGSAICQPDKGWTMNHCNEEYVSWVISGPVEDKHISKNWKVSGCTTYGDKTYTAQDKNCNSSQTSGVVFMFAEDSTSLNNNAYNCRFGSWAWGGAANARSHNGVADNPVWNKNIQFIGGISKNVHSGHWMSRSSNSLISNTTCSEYVDVTLDFEGCEGCTASTNTVTDTTGAGGAMVCLYGNYDIEFSGNTVRIAKDVTGLGPRCLESNHNVNYKGNTVRNYGLHDAAVLVQDNVGSPSPRSSEITVNMKLREVRIQMENVDGVSIDSEITTKRNVNVIRLQDCKDHTLAGKLKITTDDQLEGHSNSPVQIIHTKDTTSIGDLDIESLKINGLSGDVGMTIFATRQPGDHIKLKDSVINTLFLSPSFLRDVDVQANGFVRLHDCYESLIRDDYHVSATVLKDIGGTRFTNPTRIRTNVLPTSGSWQIGDICEINKPAENFDWLYKYTAAGWKSVGKLLPVL